MCIILREYCISPRSYFQLHKKFMVVYHKKEYMKNMLPYALTVHIFKMVAVQLEQNYHWVVRSDCTSKYHIYIFQQLMISFVPVYHLRCFIYKSAIYPGIYISFIQIFQLCNSLVK